MTVDSDDGNDGRFPDGLTRYPVTDEQTAGDRASWPWITASISSQCGPDEWTLVIEDERAATIEDGAFDAGRMYPVIFRDGSEIRLPDPTVQEMRAIFFPEDGDTR
jgi:hypothetical protein